MQMDISKMVQVRLDMHNSTFNQYIGLAKNFVTSSRKTQTNFLANQILTKQTDWQKLSFCFHTLYKIFTFYIIPCLSVYLHQ